MTDTANRDGQSPAKALDADTIRRVAEGKHADRSRLRRFLRDHRPAVGSFVVLDRGRVALQATKAELGSAEALVRFMEELAHPGGAGVASTGGTV